MFNDELGFIRLHIHKHLKIANTYYTRFKLKVHKLGGECRFVCAYTCTLYVCCVDYIKNILPSG
jgi:hypothetical protein